MFNILKKSIMWIKKISLRTIFLSLATISLIVMWNIYLPLGVYHPLMILNGLVSAFVTCATVTSVVWDQVKILLSNSPGKRLCSLTNKE